MIELRWVTLNYRRQLQYRYRKDDGQWSAWQLPREQEHEERGYGSDVQWIFS